MPEPEKQPVSVVIPTWNGRELLERFLPTVVRAMEVWPGGGEILVVDDGGTDDTPALLARKFPQVRLLRLEENLGFAGAVNRGVAEAVHEVVILLNNDVGVEQNFIGPLVRWFTRRQDVFAVCARSLDWDGATFRDGGKVGRWRRGFWRVWQNYDVDPRTRAEGTLLLSIYCPGGFTAVDRGRWLALGGLDELFSPFNWEDTDICYRALKRGWLVLYEPDSTVFHSPGTTIGGGAFRRSYVRFISRRNRLLFHWKNLTDRRMLAQHAGFLLLYLPQSLLRLDFASLAALAAAAARIGPVRRRRKKEKAESTVGDREIRETFRRFLQSGYLELKP